MEDILEAAYVLNESQHTKFLCEKKNQAKNVQRKTAAFSGNHCCSEKQQ
jgi:hypothetical protein